MRCLAILLLAACVRTAVLSGPADERAIVEALLAELKLNEARLVVSDEVDRSALHCGADLCGVEPKLWKAFDDAKRSGSLPVLPERLQAVVARDASRADRFMSQSLYLSPIGFSGRRAMVSVGYVCGPLCGHGMTCVLEHDAKGWRIVDIVMRWVS